MEEMTIGEPFSVNVAELRDRHKNRCNNRVKTYDKILEKCYYRINTSANNDETYCLYPIPDFILGMPTYSLPYCAAYIIYHLRNRGFNTQFFNPNIIFISWNFDVPYYCKQQAITDDFKVEIGGDTKKINVAKPKQNYRSITDYKPTGILY